jgi:hypothetical protein
VNLVVIVDMRSNNPKAAPLPLVDDSERADMTVFSTYKDIAALKRGHMLGPFPWLVIDIDHPSFSPTLFPPNPQR